MKIANRAKRLNPSMTLAIADQASKMKRENIDVISFATGEPDFDTPDQIKAEAISWIEKGYTKYVATNGIPALKKAIQNKLLNENGIEYATSQILVCNGAKQAIYEALGAILDPGDEVLIPTPCYVSYIEQVKLFDGVPVLVPTSEQEGFRLQASDIEKFVTSRTKAIVLNSPNNPTGAIIQPDELRKIADIAVKNEFFVISDEVYELLVYGGNKCQSIASLNSEVKKLTITVNSLSKSYCMTGWRIGYAAADKKVIDAMADMHGHMTGNVNSMSQKAAVEALENFHDFRPMIDAYAHRKALMVSKLNAMPGIHCASPDGAFYAFPNVSSYFGAAYNGTEIKNAFDLAKFLLEQAHVACVSGDAFSMEGYLRFTFAIAQNRLLEGLDRVEAALKRLR